MKIAMASDHAGFEMKEHVKKYLIGKGYQVEDFGALLYDTNDDYPDYISKAAGFVSKNGGFGIIFGKSGAGEAIVANKIKGVRAVLAVNEENVKLAREHNDANVLSIGSNLVSLDKANELVNLFINTPFSNEQRHMRRVNKIKDIENESK